MKSFKAPDVHAPRFRPKRKWIVDKAFKNSVNDKLRQSKPLETKDLLAIVETFNTTLYKEVINNRDGAELPEQLGCIFLGRCMPKVSLNTDFKHSADQQQVVEHKNWDSNDFLLKIFYHNYDNRYRFQDHEIWGFEASRQFSRAASKAFKDIWTKCIHIDHSLQISKLFHKRVFKQNSEEYKTRVIEEYDEFEI